MRGASSHFASEPARTLPSTPALAWSLLESRFFAVCGGGRGWLFFWLFCLGLFFLFWLCCAVHFFFVYLGGSVFFLLFGQAGERGFFFFFCGLGGSIMALVPKQRTNTSPSKQQKQKSQNSKQKRPGPNSQKSGRPNIKKDTHAPAQTATKNTRAAQATKKTRTKNTLADIGVGA